MKPQVRIFDFKIPSTLKPYVSDYAGWIMSGIYYGYPVCCILAFVKGKGNELAYEHDHIHNNLGFMPCNRCSEKILSCKVKTHELISDRKCSLPYPEDHGNVPHVWQDPLGNEIKKGEQLLEI